MLRVVTFLWDDPARQRSYTFDESHVLTLRNMVQRHLSVPHEFVCVTDRFIEGIRCVPLDNRTHVPGTCGRKLTVWAPDAKERIGERILALDLDIAVVGDITPLVSRFEDVVLFRNPNFSIERRRAFYQGSVQLLTAGSRPRVWNEIFKPGALERVNRRFGGFEQAWLSEVLPWTESVWTSEDGIYGAGRLGDMNPESMVETELPANARIVVLPGNRAPHQPEVQAKHPWLAEHYQ